MLLASTVILGMGRAEDTVTDAAVDRAIQRAVAWIKGEREKGHWDKQNDPASDRFGGDTSLALLALLYAGEDPRQDDMTESLKWLAGQTLSGTYSIGVRAHALALVPGTTYRSVLQKDVDWLGRAIGPKGSETAGGYRYKLDQAGKDADNSASQYGVLGMWMASEAGVNVPESYWQLVEGYWLLGQMENGGWAYQRGTGESATGSMTAAGLASLFVVLEKAHAKDEGVFNGTSSPNCGRHKDALAVLGAIRRGMEWFGGVFTTSENPGAGSTWLHYYLYGVERIGRASGQKYFKDRDWFRTGAADLLRKQLANGSWSGGGEVLHDTCFALMFLCHGRAPIFFAKLEHGDDWNNKIRDVAGLTRFAERRFERLLNWQVVTLKAPIADLLESPVLYMAGHTAWEFSEEEIGRLREYTLRGGMLLGVACCSKDAFSEGFRAMLKRALPEYELRPVGAAHPLLSKEVQSEITNPPPLFEVHNGVRTLALLSTKDICAPWNQGHRAKWDSHFNLGCNIYLYATDKSSIRSRLQSVDIAPKQVSVRRTITVARLKYNGLWDPEPYGWSRLGVYLNNEAGVQLKIAGPVALDSPELSSYKIAHLTGSGPVEFTAAELAGLRTFIYEGGTLLIDAAGGSTEFGESIEKQLAELLKQELKFVDKNDAILTGSGIADGISLEGVEYRRAARREGRGQKFPRLRVFNMGHRLGVIFAPMDVSAGLLGVNIYNVRGYDPEGCLRIMRNMLLYAALPTSEKAKLSKAASKEGP